MVSGEDFPDEKPIQWVEKPRLPRLNDASGQVSRPDTTNHSESGCECMYVCIYIYIYIS